MIAVVQRVVSAQVTVGGAVIGRIERGICVLASILHEDTDTDLKWMAEKIVSLRIFPKDDKAYDLDVREAGGSVLLISNFTVSGETKRGRRPSLGRAMSPVDAKPVFEKFIQYVKETKITLATGSFGADMRVSIENDGPTTFIIDSRAK